jgi:hypothetical protein
MLANALLAVALAAVIASSVLTAGLAMTRMAIERGAEMYAVVGYQRALDALVQDLRTHLQAGTLPQSPPAPLPAACVDGGNPCSYETSAAIAFVQTAAPAAASSCDTSQSNCAVNEEANPYVAEGRVIARITVNVSTAQGAVLTTRTNDVVLRTLSVPPYVTVAGTRDGTFDDVASAATAGDDGGAPPATPNPCTAASAGSSIDTTVRVAYQNAQSSACSDGSRWQNGSYTIGGSAPSGWSP